jgi:hypothetical protein
VTCHACPATAVRTLGTVDYCPAHLAALYARFDPAVLHHHGVGVQTGRQRADFGPGYAELSCVACEATWVGLPGEACWWCARTRRIDLEHQADLALTPPEVDPSDATYIDRMNAWRDRLRVAVEAGTIDQTHAERAWKVARGSDVAA